MFIDSSGDIHTIMTTNQTTNKAYNITNKYSIMTTLKHTIGFININSVEQVMETLNSLDHTTCTIEDKNITSVVLSIDIDYNYTLQDVLSLGTLIGSIQANSLI